MEQDKQLEIYVHIPFCTKKCSYCDFLSAPSTEEMQKSYVNALLHEVRFYGEQFGRCEASSVYIGGGTPSVLKAEYIELLLKQLQVSFAITDEAEITIECNPGTLTVEKLKRYRKAGINRLSIGLQSTFEDELTELGRIHSYQEFLDNYELAGKCGFTNINIDLMSALPYQTTEKFLTSLKRVIRLKPQHISAYSLIIEKGTPFYGKYKFDAVLREAGKPTEKLPSEETEYEIYKETQRLLQEAGYIHYEISNYAKPGYACKHNIGYWNRTPYLGMGLGAASLIDEIRYTNVTGLEDYIEKCRHIIRADGTDKETNTAVPMLNLHETADAVKRREQMEEYLFLGLRMTEGITRAGFAKTFGVEIEAVYGAVLRKLQEENLLVLQAGIIRLSDRGTDISNYVLAQFLAE